MLDLRTIGALYRPRTSAYRGPTPASSGSRGLLAAIVVVISMAVALSADRSDAQTFLTSPHTQRTNLYDTVGRLYGVDPALLEAIAHVESGGYAGAVSPKGAQGLMQLMPSTAKEFEVDTPFDPVENVLGAARFLVFLQAWLSIHDTFAPTLPALLAAYNAGPGAVERYHGIPPYQETREYVQKVLTSLLMEGGQVWIPGSSAAVSKAPIIRSSRKPSPDQQWLSQLEEIRRERKSVANSEIESRGN